MKIEKLAREHFYCIILQTLFSFKLERPISQRPLLVTLWWRRAVPFEISAQTTDVVCAKTRSLSSNSSRVSLAAATIFIGGVHMCELICVRMGYTHHCDNIICPFAVCGVGVCEICSYCRKQVLAFYWCLLSSSNHVCPHCHFLWENVMLTWYINDGCQGTKDFIA